MRTLSRSSFYCLFYGVICLMVLDVALASKGDPFTSAGKDLLDPKTGQAIKTKAGKQTKNLPSNPEQLPATGNNWSLEVQYCALYLENDIQRFRQLLEQKGAKESDVAQGLKSLEASIYPQRLRTEDKKGWATDGWIFVQDCRGFALVARKALRDYWKSWTPSKAVKEEEATSVDTGESSVGAGAEKIPGHEAQKLKEELALLKKAICQVFNPVIKETPLEKEEETQRVIPQEPEGKEDEEEEKETQPTVKQPTPKATPQVPREKGTPRGSGSNRSLPPAGTTSTPVVSRTQPKVTSVSGPVSNLAPKKPEATTGNSDAPQSVGRRRVVNRAELSKGLAKRKESENQSLVDYNANLGNVN